MGSRKISRNRERISRIWAADFANYAEEIRCCSRNLFVFFSGFSAEAFLLDPADNVGRTILDGDITRLGGTQKNHGFAVNKCNVRQVYGDGRVGASGRQCAFQFRNVFFRELTTQPDAQLLVVLGWRNFQHGFKRPLCYQPCTLATNITGTIQPRNRCFLMPRARILDSSVDAGTPSRTAAPSGPDTRPCVSFNMASI